MSINRWMGTEIVVHKCNGMLSFKKNIIESVLMRWMNPRVHCIEWSKSARERQTLYVNACVWNLERGYWRTYLQGSNGDPDIENRLVDTVREGECGMNWESSMETYTLPYVKQIASGNLLVTYGAQPSALWQSRGVGWGGRWEGGLMGRGHMCTCDWFTVIYGRNQHSIIK